MPAAFEPKVLVTGLGDLQRAFARCDPLLKRELRTELRKVAEPVASDAERLALAGITHIGIPWSRMRVGVTRRSVYVAPKQRGVKTRGRGRLRRPNLAPLLLERAMGPAVQNNEGLIVGRAQHVLDVVGRDWERG